MGMFDFRSPGAAAFEGIHKILAESEAKKRQDMLDEITKKTAARQDEVARGQLDVNRETLTSLQEQRKAAQDALEQKNVLGLLQQTGMGGDVSAELAARAKAADMGGMLNAAPTGVYPGVIASSAPSIDGSVVKPVNPNATFKGTPAEQNFSAVEKSVQSTLADPKVDEPTKTAIRMAIAGKDMPGLTSIIGKLMTPDKTVRRIWTSRTGEEFLMEGDKKTPLPAGFVRSKDDVYVNQPAPPTPPFDVSTLSPAALQALIGAAQAGRLPNINRGNAGVINAVYGAVGTEAQPGATPPPSSAEAARDAGAGLAGAANTNEALRGTEKSLTLTKHSMEAFSNSAALNMKVLDGVLNTVPDWGVKFLDKPIQALADQLGSTGVARMNTLKATLNADYARLVTSAQLSGSPLSDSARHDMDAGTSDGATPAQLRAAFDTFATESKNRLLTTNQQLEAVKLETTHRKTRAAEDAKSATDAQKPRKYNPVSGKLE